MSSHSRCALALLASTLLPASALAQQSAIYVDLEESSFFAFGPVCDPVAAAADSSGHWNTFDVSAMVPMLESQPLVNVDGIQTQV